MESGIGLAGGCGGNGGVALILVYEGRRCSNGYGFDGGGDFGACDGMAVAAAASGTKPDAILASAADAVLTGGEVLCGSELDFFTSTFGCSELAIVVGFCLKMVLSEIIWSISVSRSSGISPPVVDGGCCSVSV